jgi:hypothetical protein
MHFGGSRDSRSPVTHLQAACLTSSSLCPEPNGFALQCFAIECQNENKYGMETLKRKTMLLCLKSPSHLAIQVLWKLKFLKRSFFRSFSPCFVQNGCQIDGDEKEVVRKIDMYS